MVSTETRADEARLRWRCRRGMRELDFLLARYLDNDYALAPPAERAAFARVLELQDPLLWALILGRARLPDPDLAHVIDRITRHRSA